MQMKNKFLKTTAKIIRVITVPPVMIALLIILLTVCTDSVFVRPWDVAVALLTLAFIPLLAYPLSYAVVRWRAKGRECQRKIALILTPISYLIGIIYGFISGCSRGAMMIFTGYFISASALLLFNFALSVRASGHACCVAGPILYASYWLGLSAVIAGAVLYPAVAWASISMKRHTPREFILGTLVSCAAFALSVIIW